MEKKEITDIAEKLNPDEKKILPFLKLGTAKKIREKAGLEKVRVLRALQYLENKDVVKLKKKKIKTIDLDKNGVSYLKHDLPERRLVNLLAKEESISIEKAKKFSNLSKKEFKAALGVLKNKALIQIIRGKLILQAKNKEISKKSLEEQFLEQLPLKLSSLKPEQKLAFNNLKKRKNIIKVEEKTKIKTILTSLGKNLIKQDLKKVDLIEELTPEIIKNQDWRGGKFRKYDLTSKVPKKSGGKKHFVNQAIEYAKKIWLEMGFQEMEGNLTQTGFWNFDALFQPQDHPARDMHDTFYIDLKGKLPDKIVSKVKKAHEKGTKNSKGWQYKWQEDEAKKVLLRTHTTCLSARTLAKLKKLKNKKGKFFAIGKCFRNETLDWSHSFEFNQSEGIVVDKNANFKHLLGYLKQFYKKMGFDNVRFAPAYFPYTEPSVEINIWNSEKNQWLELGGAGIFRPEVVIPLLGEYIPVLAWGPGFDRTIMDYYNIKDLREMYKNDIKQLREKKFWLK